MKLEEAIEKAEQMIKSFDDSGRYWMEEGLDDPGDYDDCVLRASRDFERATVIFTLLRHIKVSEKD